MAKKIHIKGLYYITHMNNIPSMLDTGILSHQLVEEKGVQYTPIYDSQIVSNRKDRFTPNGQSLWQFANVYFQPRNPMLYRVINEKNKNDIAILGVKPSVLNSSGAFVSTGNAASSPSEILPVNEGLSLIHQMWSIINNDWWKEEDGSKRKIMAECLVPKSIDQSYIHTIFVSGNTAADKVRNLIKRLDIPVVIEPHMFFQPNRRISITKNLSIIDGDMFFSQMQTLTISVNTVGVMGKGLASRAKYQFPDVYVYYQDACRQKKLLMGKPYLYKRESYVDSELSDDPASLANPNSNKWFLLFATKSHWREKSDFAGIEKGLVWLQEHYKTEGIKSLAMPALGCGLGGLLWQDVGPLMCKYCSRFDISVGIYLPQEQEISEGQKTRDFLLGKIE